MLVAAGLLDPAARSLVWTGVLVWMGAGCLLNARRCGRTHCRYTGPYYLLMIGPVAVLGVGIITLGGQLALKLMGLVETGFWVIVGLFFALGGIWILIDMEVSLVPILLIIAGLAMIGRLLREWLIRR